MKTVAVPDRLHSELWKYSEESGIRLRTLTERAIIAFLATLRQTPKPKKGAAR